MKAGGEPGQRIQSLERADAILSAIARAQHGRARLVEIAAETGLHKNTVFSLLKTLVALGYCEHIRDQGYRIGRRTFELARLAERNLDLVTAVRPLMLRLVWEVRESLSLGIPASDHCVVVSTVEGSYAVRGSRFHGQQAPYHASALGKAVIASLSDEDRAQVVNRIKFEKYTGRTITSPALLEEECTRVREKGYAISVAEEEVGASAVAVPLFSRAGDVVGALALWGPSARLTRPALAEYGHTLMRECRTVLV
jgi:DNA-binding IclR family transcriptional regulator